MKRRGRRERQKRGRKEAEKRFGLSRKKIKYD